MKWWIAIVVLYIGCGESNPIGNSGPADSGSDNVAGSGSSILVIRVSDLNDYIAELSELFVPVAVIVT